LLLSFFFNACIASLLASMPAIDELQVLLAQTEGIDCDVVTAADIVCGDDDFRCAVAVDVGEGQAFYRAVTRTYRAGEEFIIWVGRIILCIDAQGVAAYATRFIVTFGDDYHAFGRGEKPGFDDTAAVVS
jgi:hypothetical protein